MTTLATVLTAQNITALKTNVDAFFAANLTIRILNIQFIAREQVSTLGMDLAVAIQYDLNGSLLTAPYVSNFQQGKGATQLGTAVSTFLATVTTQFNAGPFVDLQLHSRLQNSYTSLIITNESIAQGQANWIASPAQSGLPSVRLDVADAVAFSVGPAAGTINGAAAPAGGYQLAVNTLDFDDTLDEGVYWKYPILPAAFPNSNLIINFKWTATAIVGNVVWRATAAGIAAGDIITAETHGTFVTTTETAPGAADTVLNASISLTNAQADTLVGADYMQILFGREGSADTMTGDARLIGAELLFA